MYSVQYNKIRNKVKRESPEGFCVSLTISLIKDSSSEKFGRVLVRVLISGILLWFVCALKRTFFRPSEQDTNSVQQCIVSPSSSYCSALYSTAGFCSMRQCMLLYSTPTVKIIQYCKSKEYSSNGTRIINGTVQYCSSSTVPRKARRD